jgi:hypothetical protein
MMIDNNQQNHMTRLMIGTPMYGGQCQAHYLFSMLNLTRSAAEQNLDLNFQFTTTESLITRARTHIANTFLRSTCSHLLFVDADIGFQPQHVTQLLSHDLPLVCGGYPAKHIDWHHVAQAAKSGVPGHELKHHASAYIYNRLIPQPSNTPPGLIEVLNAGTGFMLIARSVFETLAPLVPKYQNNQFDNAHSENLEFFSTAIKHNILLSEDHYFCDLWRSVGGRIFVDPTIHLQHVGSHVYESSPNHWIS